MGMGHNWLTITHQCGLSERTPSSPPPFTFLPHALLLHGDSEGAASPHKHPFPPPLLPLFICSESKNCTAQGKNDGGREGWRKKKKKRERKRGREVHKHTLQIQLHTRGWDTHACTHTTSAHKHTRAHTPGGASKSH